jgi:hypothetical protein
MASQGILSGAGQFMLISNNLDASLIAQNLMWSPDLLDFTLEENLGTPRKAKKMTCTGLKVVATSPGQEEVTLKISSEVPDRAFLELAEGELIENVALTLPVYKQATVPLTTAFEINDADVVSGNSNQIMAYNASYSSAIAPGPLIRVSAAPASAKEFQAAAGKLTLHSSMAGAAIVYAVPKAYTSMPSLGKAANPTYIGELQFIGHACGTGFEDGVIIHIKRISRTSKPTWNPGTDVPTFEITYEALLAPGERAIVQKYFPKLAAV